MKNTTKIALALTACSAIVLGAGVAKAAPQNVNVPATLLIANSFAFAQTAVLNFGSVAIVNDGAALGTPGTLTLNPTTAVLTASANDVLDVTQDYFRPLTGTSGAGITAGAFGITGAAATTVINITLPAAPIQLDCAICTPGNPELTLDSWTTNAAASKVTTSAAGAASFTVGGTLSTDEDAAQEYENGTYVGSYTVTAAY